MSWSHVLPSDDICYMTLPFRQGMAKLWSRQSIPMGPMPSIPGSLMSDLKVQESLEDVVWAPHWETMTIVFPCPTRWYSWKFGELGSNQGLAQRDISCGIIMGILHRCLMRSLLSCCDLPQTIDSPARSVHIGILYMWVDCLEDLEDTTAAKPFL